MEKVINQENVSPAALAVLDGNELILTPAGYALAQESNVVAFFFITRLENEGIKGEGFLFPKPKENFEIKK